MRFYEALFDLSFTQSGGKIAIFSSAQTPCDWTLLPLKAVKKKKKSKMGQSSSGE